MRITVARSLSDHAPEIRRLVRFAHRGEIDGADVEVHVKRRRNGSFSGFAYRGVPAMASVAPKTRWLVTLHLLHPDDAPTYPRRWTYHAATTAGPIDLHSWREDVLHLAAHEARHLMQYRDERPASEVDAENYARSVLRRWRRTSELTQAPLE